MSRRVVLLAALAISCSPRPPPPPRAAPPAPALDGEKLARTHCTTCHLFPEPSIHAKRDWVAVLHFMGHYLGYDDAGMRREYPPAEFANIIDVSRIPGTPVVTRAEWRAIRDFYAARAPAIPEPRVEAPLPPLPGFDVVDVPYRPQLAFTPFVQVPRAGGVLAGDGLRRALMWLDATGRVTRTVVVPGIPVRVQEHDDGLVVSLIGHFEPSNASKASVVQLKHDGTIDVLVEGLQRTPDARLLDLDGDKRPELVTAQFGHHAGQLALHHRAVDGVWQSRTLVALPGAARIELADFTRDGMVDILVMFAQAWESVHLLVNRGGLAFDDVTLLREHPAFGSSSFATADFNGDGVWDLVQVNGDNGDLPIPPLRGYHGIRIHLNRGDNTFDAPIFLPMYGAYHAVPCDLDADGDPDLAAVAFFPDFSSKSARRFVAFLNDGKLHFTAYGLPADVPGRFVGIDAGDIDRDGDIDLVLAGASHQAGINEDVAWRQLAAEGRAVVILRNQKQRPSSRRK